MDDQNPYSSPNSQAPNVSSEPNRSVFAEKCKVIGIVIAFSIPAIAMLMLAWHCFTVVASYSHSVFAPFFLYGGHALVLGICFALANAIVLAITIDKFRAEFWVQLCLTTIYGPTTILSWLMIYFGVFSAM